MLMPDLRDAAAHLDAGEAITVVTRLEPVVRMMPSYAAAHVLLARAYGMTEQWTEAHTTWKKACLLVPTSQVLRASLLHSTQMLRRAARAKTAPVPKPTPVSRPVAPSETPRQTTAPSVADSNHKEIDVSLKPIQSRMAFPAEARLTPVPATEPQTVLGSKPRSISSSPRSARSTARAGSFDNLDDLIAQLEGARIEPRPDMDALPAPELESDIEDMVSETLARIYAAQKQFGEAANVYDKLAEQQPDRAEEYHAMATDLRKRTRKK